MTIKIHKGHRCVVLSEGEKDERWVGYKQACTILQPANLTALRCFVAEEEAKLKKPEKPEVPAVDLAKELAELRAQLAAVTKTVPAETTKADKPSGRFAAK